MLNYQGLKPTVGTKILDSSFIDFLGYNRNARLLFVGMNGRTTIYDGVDEALYTDFVAAESKGSYLNAVIKSRNFSYEMVNATFSDLSFSRFSKEQIAQWRAVINACPVVAL